MEQLFLGVLIGLVAGFGGWHLYYMRALPQVVKKVGYTKRSKNKAARAPRVSKESVPTSGRAEKDRTAPFPPPTSVRPLAQADDGSNGPTAA